MNVISEFKNGCWLPCDRHLAVRAGVLALCLAGFSSPASIYTILHHFTGSDGAAPEGGLVLSGTILYGTTTGGGSSNAGTVFKVNIDGSGYTVLKNFDATGGYGPRSLVLSGTTLYGNTAYSVTGRGGTVFKVSTDGSGYAVLRDFDAGSTNTGWCPEGALVLSGTTLYGTTLRGGSWDAGTVFKVNTDGSGYAVLKSFCDRPGTEGYWPEGGLVLSGSTLYGTTTVGGAEHTGGGTVFKINTDGSGYTVLKSFAGSDGACPFAKVTLSGTTLYGTTYSGGNSWTQVYSGYGTVFKINTDGSGFTVLRNFSLQEDYGIHPYAGLVLAGTTYYGTCRQGSSYGKGTLYEVMTNGSGAKMFSGRDGAEPMAELVLSGTTVYGTTYAGGTYDKGVVFKWSEPVAPSLLTQPQTQTAEAGATVRFTVDALGEPPPAYQWFFSDNVLAGCTNRVLCLTRVEATNVGAYTVVVTNLVCAVTSSPATLNVISPVERRLVPGVSLMGQAGDFLGLDYKDNLGPAANWETMTTMTLSNALQFYLDVSEMLPPQRFYRAWQPAPSSVAPALDLRMVAAITLTGTVGSSVRVDYINQFGPIDGWVNLATVTLTNTSQLYFDTSSISQPPRLWRIVPVR